jgi:hypothetical protein
MVSTLYQTPPHGELKEHEFNEFDLVSCEKNMKKGGGTRREFAENLIKSGEESWNKWCVAPCPGNTNWTIIEFQKTIFFSDLGFKSANDEPNRDPTSVEVYILSPQHEWIFCDAFLLSFNPEQRFETVMTKMNQVYRTRGLLFFFRNSRKCPDMQLAQIRVFYRE